MIDADLLKTALRIYKEGVLPKTKVKGMKRSVSLLVKMGWVAETKEGYKFVLSTEKFADILTGLAKGETMSVPFRSKIYGTKSFAYIRLPAYVVRTFNISKGDLLVIRYKGARITGTISSEKNMFYIHKKYWKDLGIPKEGIQKPTEDMDFVLEGIYRGQGSGEKSAE